MPTDVSSSSSAPGSPDIKRVSNALENMVAGSIGPDQSTCRVTAASYVSFDYAGKFSADPVVAVKATCLPIDGSNDNKEFDVEWTTGAKMSEFAIIDDGGYLAPTGSKNTLAVNSNWALLLKSLADASFDSKLLDGARGIRFLEGIEWTIRRVPQPVREGIVKKEGDRAATYYTCLKIDTLPGEKKPAAGKTRAAAKPAAAAAAATTTTAAAAPAPATTTASSNGTGDLSDKLVDFISAVLTANNNTVPVAELPKLIFKQAKSEGLSTVEAQKYGKAATEDFLIDQAMSNDMLGWAVDNGSLAVAAA